MRKGELVTYRVGGSTFSAVVRTCHRDGSYTVEARHALADGKPYGAYLGFLYRMHGDDLTAKECA